MMRQQALPLIVLCPAVVDIRAAMPNKARSRDTSGPTNNLLLSASGTDADSFTYEGNGNLKVATGASFSYTPGNQMRWRPSVDRRPTDTTPTTCGSSASSRTERPGVSSMGQGTRSSPNSGSKGRIRWRSYRTTSMRAGYFLAREKPERTKPY